MRNNNPAYDRGKRVELTWCLIEKALADEAAKPVQRRRLRRR